MIGNILVYKKNDDLQLPLILINTLKIYTDGCRMHNTVSSWCC